MPVIKAKLKDLKFDIFVRKELNQDHALYLAELIQNGVKLPPIWITSDNQVVEGRHRIEAHELNDREEIDAEVKTFASKAEMIAAAYKANTGGSLPPSPSDTETTVMSLIECGESKKHIAELLGLPPAMARRYVTDVQSRMTRAKVQRAVDMVTGGSATVTKAAEAQGVPVEKVKEAISGRRKKKNGITEAQRALTHTYRSLGIKNASMMRALIEKYEDGDVQANEVRDILCHVEELQKKSSRSITDWKKRFEAIATNSKNGKK